MVSAVQGIQPFNVPAEVMVARSGFPLQNCESHGPAWQDLGAGIVSQSRLCADSGSVPACAFAASVSPATGPLALQCLCLQS